MEHFNPLLLHNDSPAKFITMGEVMLRLTPPNYEKIRMASNFEASYGGSEANIALALANLGVDSTFFSVVPNNSLGKSAVRWLRSNDVHCTPMILSTPEETPTHRLGTYYLETGYGIRPSKVIYDRKHSAFTEYDLSKVDLDALLSHSDVIFLHCNLTAENEKLINKTNIAKMKDGAILINNSRGQLIDEQDVADALASGKLAAAGLDVVYTEPIKADNPLLKAPNCIITPHMSWGAKEARQRIMDITADNVKAYLAGKPINVVNL